MPAVLKAIQHHFSLSLLIFPMVIASNHFYFPISFTHPPLLHWYQISFPPSYLLEKIEANTSVFTPKIFSINGWEPRSGYSLLRLITPGEKESRCCFCWLWSWYSQSVIPINSDIPSHLCSCCHIGVWIISTWFSNIWIMFPQMSDSPRKFFHKSKFIVPGGLKTAVLNGL